MAIDLKSKFTGALMGCAVGDAIGELAFTHPQQDFLSTRLNHEPVLHYTDDTAMAIGIAESLIQVGDIDQQRRG